MGDRVVPHKRRNDATSQQSRAGACGGVPFSELIIHISEAASVSMEIPEETEYSDVSTGEAWADLGEAFQTAHSIDVPSGMKGRALR